MANLYYTAPSQECFDDMKSAAIRVWSRYDDPYRSEKLSRIEHIENHSDNFMYILAMFDHNNQQEVGLLISEETREAARERMLAGGMHEVLLPF